MEDAPISPKECLKKGETSKAAESERRKKENIPLNEERPDLNRIRTDYRIWLQKQKENYGDLAVFGDDDELNEEGGKPTASSEYSHEIEGKVPKHRARRETTIDIPGLTMSIQPGSEIKQMTYNVKAKLAIILVGLPARGKSYIGKKLQKYYNWLRYSCKIFNVGNRRRQEGQKKYSMDASFFDPNNPEAKQFREELAKSCLEEMLHWLQHENGVVGILDATNSTFSRRKLLVDRISQIDSIRILFVESICTDEKLIEENIRLKIYGPDYKGTNKEEALGDFRKRVALYEKTYETLGEQDERLDKLQYVKLINVGKKVVTHNVTGFLAGQAVCFMLNLNLQRRQIWFTRHGESSDSLGGIIGGYSSLTTAGLEYAQSLTRFINEQRLLWLSQRSERISQKHLRFREGDEVSFSVWSSMRRRGIEMTQFFDPNYYDVKAIRMLDEMNTGQFENLTIEQFLSAFPENPDSPAASKLLYRFSGHGGESYLDVIHRLHAVILELERLPGNVLIVAHRVVSSILMTYFMNYSQQEMFNVGLPLHSLYCIELGTYDVICSIYQYNADSRKFTKVKEQHVPF
ncbi:6-phosphofructo-2-kinase [Schizosaccharomyces japonicus yFS275]|uniref:6-phosphofructo-2-kinase n=1 Tax=Schizosaccharomyces japonicus (strain yFS275 / FY16936) TaxID=402676 RepID=B6K0N8_SCHJY|nr:6-phosphofructo-2-kinase [Schizosaccharomyces japonicus yFS275]EEB07509.1 6-phosphofructo-2-kinase [Schizosaccharomyces japonicus yFS275]